MRFFGAKKCLQVVLSHPSIHHINIAALIHSCLKAFSAATWVYTIDIYNHSGITAWKPSAAWDLEVVARSAICSGLTTSPDPISQQVPTTEHLQRYFSNNPYSLSSQLVNHMGIPKSYLKRWFCIYSHEIPSFFHVTSLMPTPAW